MTPLVNRGDCQKLGHGLEVFLYFDVMILFIIVTAGIIFIL